MPAHNWKTTVTAFSPLLPYALRAAGVWPDWAPLPSLDQVWPALIGLVGVGLVAKDHDVTGGKREE